MSVTFPESVQEVLSFFQLQAMDKTALLCSMTKKSSLFQISIEIRSASDVFAALHTDDPVLLIQFPGLLCE